MSSFMFELMEFASLPVLFPLLISIFFFPKKSYFLKLISFHIFLGFYTELAARVCEFYFNNNLPVLHIFTLAEFLILSIAFTILLKSLIKPYILIIFIVLFLAFGIINSFVIQTMFEFNNNTRAIEAILFIIFSILYFFNLLRELKIKKLEKDPEFWIVSGIFIYFSCNFFLFIFSNYILVKSGTVLHAMWILHTIFNLVLYTMYSIGLWLNKGK